LVTRATAPLAWVPYPTHKAFQGFFFLVFERSSPTQKVHPSIEGPIQKIHPSIEGPFQQLKDLFKKFILLLKDPFKKFIPQFKDPFCHHMQTFNHLK